MKPTPDWLGCDAGPLYEPFRAQAETPQQRFDRKRQAALAYLGTRWLLHPANKARRINHNQDPR